MVRLLKNNLDFRAAALENVNGFADGYIVSAISKNSFQNDSLCAMIAELAPSAPTQIFRDNSYADSIPGDNIYAANYEIKRNDHMHFCFRYDQTKNALNAINGENIGRNESWNIMADSSNAGFGNVQMMQYIPEDNELMLAIHAGDAPAYECTPVIYDLNSLFTLTTVDVSACADRFIYPNPASDRLNITIYDKNNGPFSIRIFDVNGTAIIDTYSNDNSIDVDVSNVLQGVYAIKVCGEKFIGTSILIIEK